MRDFTIFHRFVSFQARRAREIDFSVRTGSSTTSITTTSVASAYFLEIHQTSTASRYTWHFFLHHWLSLYHRPFPRALRALSCRRRCFTYRAPLSPGNHNFPLQTITRTADIHYFLEVRETCLLFPLLQTPTLDSSPSSVSPV